MTDRIVMPRERLLAWLTPAEREMYFGDAKKHSRHTDWVLGHVTLPWSGCSPCRCVMTLNRGSLTYTRRPDWRTRGHYRPTNTTGAQPKDLQHDCRKPYTMGRGWSWQCYACNHDQRSYTLRQWHFHLVENHDGRAKTIAELMRFLLAYGLCENDF